MSNENNNRKGQLRNKNLLLLEREIHLEKNSFWRHQMHFFVHGIKKIAEFLRSNLVIEVRERTKPLPIHFFSLFSDYNRSVKFATNNAVKKS